MIDLAELLALPKSSKRCTSACWLIPLAPFFQNVQMDRLRQMQYQFMASALDGPSEYTGAELNAIHRGRGITGEHFAKFCGHFADAVKAAGATPREVDDALGRLATYKDKITGDTNVDG